MNLLDYTRPQSSRRSCRRSSDDLTIEQRRSGGCWRRIFLVSYSLISPVMGWLGDRYRRTWLLAVGVGVWSLATVGSGLARDYGHLALARSFLGIGEATYGVIAPTILMDLFPREQRARVMSAFYLAMPLGGGAGDRRSGRCIAEQYGWHMAFFVVGRPGPARGARWPCSCPSRSAGRARGSTPSGSRRTSRPGRRREDYLDLMVNSSYTYSVFGMAFYTFAIGGLLVWLPNYLFSTRGFDQAQADDDPRRWSRSRAAIVGMTAGGWLADRLARTNPRALFLVPGRGDARARSRSSCWRCSRPRRAGDLRRRSSLAEALMFINTGPCNAMIANVVLPNIRAAAFAVAIFAVHFLGDIWSPPLIG